MCRRVQGSQIFKQNWIISIRSRVIVILLIWLSSALGVGQVGGGCPGWSAIVYMSSGMFTGKESSNRIELSWLVQDLLNFWCFGLPAALGVGGWVDWGGWGMVRGCPHTCAHAHTCVHMHIYTLNMIISIANDSTHWGNPWEFPMMSYTFTCIRLCVCPCTCVGGTPQPPPPPNHPHPIHPPPTSQGGPGISQNSIALELIEIFQFCLKIWNLWRLPHPWVGVWFGGWVGGLMGVVRSKH